MDGRSHMPSSLAQFTWDPQFAVRQTIAYQAEDSRVEPDATETIVSALLNFWANNLVPPTLNYNALRCFLEKGNIADLRDRNRPVHLTSLALIDERRDPCGLDEDQSGQPPVSNGQTRSWTSERYTRYPPPGQNVFRKTLDEQGLYDRLCEPRSSTRAERRTLLITNLTSICAIAVYTNIAIRFSVCFRAYLQRYLLSQVHFKIKLHKTPREFMMEFHIPYCALREGTTSIDRRGLRKAFPMLPTFGQPQDEIIYNDAQVSFLITGVDEWYWTAYCFVDTFSTRSERPDIYIQQNDDGPSGGGQQEDYPIWNPREYFLLVLSRRCKQVVWEWEILIDELTARLNTYETAYYASMDGNDFFDDADLGRTKSYTKAVSIMRKFNDILNLSITTFRDFERREFKYCITGNEILDESWKEYFDSISEDFDIMQYYQRRLEQKIQTFDRMKDGLVNSSALKESRYSTRQGDDIGVLTNMTVAYLPFSLATALFSMTDDSMNVQRWLFWMLTLAIIGTLTFYIAFKRKTMSVGVKKNLNIWR